MRHTFYTAVWLLLLASAPAARAQPAEAIVTSTRQTAFTIPFRIEPAQTPEQRPVEVQLHVSTDQGANWTLSSRVAPERGSFVFRAPHDGEYWYSIRTLDAQGAARPQAPLAAQLKVIVDTVAPRLDLSVERGPAGEVVARWQAVDPNLAPKSFKLEYQAASDGPWERVAVEPAPEAMRHTLSGEATWWPNGASGPLVVRGEIADAAGNPAISQAVVKPGDALPPPPAAAAASAAEGWRSAAAASQPGETTWPPDRAMENTVTIAAQPVAPAPPVYQPAHVDGGSAPAGFMPDTDPRTPAQTVSAARQSRPGSPLDFSVLPAAVRPRMVGSRQFELEYEVASVGPSGIGRVALWGTRDGGRTWSDFAIDPDNRSPMPVTVAGEGIYGFRIQVQSGSGFGGSPPAEGDMPDIWIGVDTTPPTGQILGAEVSPDGTELAVRWEAADDVLDPRPISLLFASSAAGPWTPIASGLENTGSYRWRLDSRVPQRIVLRLEVRDEAGNVGVYQTDEAVVLDRHRPEGRIRGVRAISP